MSNLVQRAKTDIRNIRVVGDIAYVPLTQGYETIIDASDAHVVSGYKWSVSKKKGEKTQYAITTKCVGGEKTSIILHRLLLNAPKNMHVDHIDSDGLNNRRNNLRLATCAQNQWNTGIKSNNKSGAKGVKWDPSRGNWRAQLQVNKKLVLNRNFATIEDAKIAYADASRKYHGEFSRV